MYLIFRRLLIIFNISAKWYMSFCIPSHSPRHTHKTNNHWVTTNKHTYYYLLSFCLSIYPTLLSIFISLSLSLFIYLSLSLPLSLFLPHSHTQPPAHIELLQLQLISFVFYFFLQLSYPLSFSKTKTILVETIGTQPLGKGLTFKTGC